MSQTSKQFGDKGEDFAVRFLKSIGYEIVERNYRYSRGEIDIIAEDPETGFLVFVEVKTRHNLNYGEPEYAVTQRKIQQIKRVAELYLFEKEISEIDCRFDVVAILFRGKESPVIKHYINAF